MTRTSIVTVLLGFALALLGSMPPVGPTAALVLRGGLARRYREALHVAVGGALAEATYCAIAASSVGPLLRRTPLIESIARIVGIVVLLSLGLQFLRARIVDATPSREVAAGRSFLVGWSAGIASPVTFFAWSMVIVLLSSTGRFELSTAGRLWFALAVFAGVLTWFALLIVALRRFGGRITLLGTHRLLRATGALLTMTSMVLAWRVLRG